jgi:hypothetical protein
MHFRRVNLIYWFKFIFSTTQIHYNKQMLKITILNPIGMKTLIWSGFVHILIHYNKTS